MTYKYNTIYELKLSSNHSVRYWFDENDEIHIAVWSYHDCTITDEDEVSYIIKELVKHILQLQGESNNGQN